MNASIRVFVLAGPLTLLLAPAALALDVTFEANAATLTIVDDGPGDLNAVDAGVIDFDLTASPVGGVFSGVGRVLQATGVGGSAVHLGGAESTSGILQNVGVGDEELKVTVNSSALSEGPPLGWAVSYNASFDDPNLNPVSSPAGLVELVMNQTTTPVPLISIPQPVISAPDAVALNARGTDASYAAAEVRLVYTVELGPDDRAVIPDVHLGSAIAGYVYNQLYKCIDRMTNDCGKTADSAAASDAKCVALQSKEGGGDATSCVDDPLELKANRRETKLLADFAHYCQTLPAWGVNGATCCEEGANDGALCTVSEDCPDGSCVPGACMSHASELTANDLTHELFGAAVTVGATTGRCQSGVLKSAGKALKERWKTLRTCKRTSVETISDDVGLVATCLGPPQTDPDLRIARADSKVARDVNRCIDAGFSPVGAEFGGACTDVGDELFPACVAERIQCAFCRALNVTDDLSPALDCDLFDDATANSSCP